MENKELSGVIGPYDEGSELKIRCESDGGNEHFMYFNITVLLKFSLYEGNFEILIYDLLSFTSRYL